MTLGPGIEPGTHWSAPTLLASVLNQTRTCPKQVWSYACSKAHLFLARAKRSGGNPVRKRQESEPYLIRVLHWVLSYTGYDLDIAQKCFMNLFCN